MSVTRDEDCNQLRGRVLAVLEEAVASRVFPGAVAAVVRKGGDEVIVACGRETYDPSAPPVTIDAIFDVASLTKVVATTTAVMQLMEAGELRLRDRGSTFIPQLDRPSTREITISQLLTHRAGFPGGEVSHRHCSHRMEVLEAVFSSDLAYLPGSRRVYDDLSFIILGCIIETITGASLDAYCASRIFRPLQMSNTMFTPPLQVRDRIIPTEIDRNRGGLLRGVVHDENAYRLDGVAGHAGLFSTIRDLSRFSGMILDPRNGSVAGVLSERSIALMSSAQWRDADGEYGLGWDRRQSRYMNGIEDPNAIGHTGFTGTSMVVSPASESAMILLSNRLYPVRSERTAIDRVRCRFVEAIVGSKA
jgi:CubicO group peptidase (beta-lactamase class C family)